MAKLLVIGLLLLMSYEAFGAITKLQQCPKGFFMQEGVCKRCPKDTFNSHEGSARECAECSKACKSRKHAHQVYACNSTHDMDCECDDTFFATTKDDQCTRHTVCGLGYIVIKEGTANSDVQCTQPTTPVETTTLSPLTFNTSMHSLTNGSYVPNPVEVNIVYQALLKLFGNDWNILIFVIAVISAVFLVSIVVCAVRTYLKKRKQQPGKYPEKRNEQRGVNFRTNLITTSNAMASLCTHKGYQEGPFNLQSAHDYSEERLSLCSSATAGITMERDDDDQHDVHQAQVA